MQHKDPHNHHLPFRVLIFIYNISVNLTFFLTKLYNFVRLRLSRVVVAITIIGVMDDNINNINKIIPIAIIIINTLTMRYRLHQLPFDLHQYELGI